MAIIRLLACQRVKKKIYCQVIQIHTETIFDIHCFLESEGGKKGRGKWNGNISESHLDKYNFMRKYCKTNRKMGKESQQIGKVSKCTRLAWEADNGNAGKKVCKIQSTQEQNNF